MWYFIVSIYRLGRSTWGNRLASQRRSSNYAQPDKRTRRWQRGPLHTGSSRPAPGSIPRFRTPRTPLRRGPTDSRLRRHNGTSPEYSRARTQTGPTRDKLKKQQNLHKITIKRFVGSRNKCK